MSRFESSRFIKDPKVMNPEALKRACDALGWKYTVKGEDLLVTDLGGREKLHGEFALKVNGGTVTSSVMLPFVRFQATATCPRGVMRDASTQSTVLGIVGLISIAA